MVEIASSVGELYITPAKLSLELVQLAFCGRMFSVGIECP